MLCDICKKNEATVHITKIINQDKQEFSICQECAKNMDELKLGGQMNFESPFSFQNILSGIMDYVNENTKSNIIYEPTCNNCGTTYSEFKKHGLLGCSECYANFSSTLMPVIKRIHGNMDHVGKIPKKSGKDLIEKKKIEGLKEDLQKAIAHEEYEKAAELRDMIREIQNNDQ